MNLQRIATIVVLGLALSPPPMGASAYSEHQVKAVFLYNFSSFVQWPADAFEDASSPLRYCVTGDTGMATLVDAVISGEQIGGRRLVFVDEPADSELPKCHVLFIGAGDRARTLETLDIVAGRTVLTVMDDEGPARRSAMIRFGSRKRRVHPLIDLDALESSGLRASAKLLQLATIVRTADVESEP